MKYAICSNMDGHRDYYTKRSKSDRERQILYDIIYVESKKNLIHELKSRNRNRPTHIENKFTVTKGEKEREIN